MQLKHSAREHVIVRVLLDDRPRPIWSFASMNKTTASILSVIATALALGGSPARGAEVLSNSEPGSASVQVASVQGPIVMGRSVALRKKTKLHHLKAKPPADVSNFENDVAVE